MDTVYLCKQISHLSGVPVRLYEGERIIGRYSIAELPYDPFELCREEVFRIEKHIGYYVTARDTYYGLVRAGDTRIVMGPTSQIPLPDQKWHDIAFLLGIKKEELSDFISSMKRIASLPLVSVVQYLCLINFIVNDGEKLSILDVTIIDSEQQSWIERKAEESISMADEREGSYPHNTVDPEQYMLGLVREGNVTELKRFFEEAPAIRGGVIAENDLRQSKNLFVVTATLVSRAAIGGGLEAEEALTMSDGYILSSEMLSNVQAVTNLNYRMVMDYAERVARLRYGADSGRLVREVTNYIFKHLSEPITVEKMARDLCRGRSRLSTDFKKETGENLGDYIMKRKVEESKRILAYTKRPAVDIALYLGFSSQSHFSRVFKKYAGLTPNEYRSSKRRS